MMTPSKEAVIDIFNYYIEQNNMYLMTQEEHKRYLEKDKQITQLTNNWNELEEWLESNWKDTQDIWYVKIINKMNKIKDGNNVSDRN